MKVYIAGKITGYPAYRQRFAAAEARLAEMGFSVMNPAWLYAYPEFAHEDYIAVSKAMLERCDAALFLDNWEASGGAKAERVEAERRGMRVFDEREGGWDALALEAPKSGGPPVAEVERLRQEARAELCAACRGEKKRRKKQNDG